MADSRYWSREVVTDFIEIYKAHPCLWKIKSREYANRNLKNTAYDKLVEFCKAINPEANRDYVVKKIQSFRGSFRKEMKKVEHTKRSGAGSEEVYTPTLWYFNLLLFTIDQELPTPSISNIIDEEGIDMSNEDGTSQEFDINNGEVEDSVERNNTQTSTEASSELPSTSHFSTRSPVSKKRSRSNKQSKAQIDFFNYCKQQLEKQDTIDEFDAAAMSWAKKMKRMDPMQAIYADMLINKIINQGLLNQLSNPTVATDRAPSPETFSPLSPFNNTVSSNPSVRQEGATSQLEYSASYYQQTGNDLQLL